MVNIKRTEERRMIHDILIIDFREAGISSKYQIRSNTIGILVVILGLRVTQNDSTDTTEATIVSSAFSKI